MFFLVNSVCLANNFDDIFLSSEEQKLERQRKNDNRNQEQKNKFPKNKFPSKIIPNSNIKIDDKITKDGFVIKQVILNGSTILSQRKINKITKNFIGKNANLININSIIKLITNLYIKHGYITSKIFLKPQNISSGLINLEVIEGKLEEFVFAESFKGHYSLSDQTRKSMAWPFLEGKILNIRDIERGLAQINRLRSNNITMDILPGAKLGYSKILLQDKSKKLPINISFNLNNSGSKSTGELKRKATASLDNMLGWNDNLLLQYSEDSVSKHKDRNFSSFYTMLDIPYGYWNLTFSYIKSRYLSTIKATNSYIKTTGISNNFTLAIKNHFFENKTHNITIDSKLSLKQSVSKMQGSLMDVQDKRLSVLSLAFTHAINGKYGYFSYTPSYFEGLKIFDARKDFTNLNGKNAHYQFRKFTLNSYYQKNFRLKKQKLFYKNNFSAQYGVDGLHSSEQFFIGDQYSVRGYKDKSAGGDSGFYIQNDLGINLPIYRLGMLANLSKLKTMQAFLAYDLGWSRMRGGKNANNNEGKAYLTGIALGLKLKGKYCDFDLTYGQSVKTTNFIGDSRALYMNFKVGF